jgi:predicted nucleotidyltransferase
VAPEPATPSQRVADALRRVVEACSPERVLLFGSRAEGRDRVDSDIDLIVVVSAHSWCRTPQQVRQLFWTAPYDVDAIVVTPEQFEEAAGNPDSFIATVLPGAIALHP